MRKSESKQGFSNQGCAGLSTTWPVTKDTWNVQSGCAGLFPGGIDSPRLLQSRRYPGKARISLACCDKPGRIYRSWLYTLLPRGAYRMLEGRCDQNWERHIS